MMTFDDMRGVLDHVRYKRGWSLLVRSETNNIYLQWVFDGPCADTGEIKPQHCRKWRLSVYMTEGELVQTAFAAALAAEEHECREFFGYKGVRVFGPHIKFSALMEAAQHIEGRA